MMDGDFLWVENSAGILNNQEEDQYLSLTRVINNIQT